MANTLYPYEIFFSCVRGCLIKINKADGMAAPWKACGHLLTRVNLTNVLDEGLRIGKIGRRMNSKVKLVEIGVCRK
jgi:hypothetical protein